MCLPHINPVYYFWMAYLVTLCCALVIPVSRPKLWKIAAYLIVSLLGFVVWPLVLWVAIGVMYRRKRLKGSVWKRS